MLVSGKNSCLAVIQKNVFIKEAFISHKFSDKFLLSVLQKRKIKINFLDKNKLNELVSKNHQGIILKIDDFPYADFDLVFKENSFLVVLDHLVDPQNMGTIIRSCEVFGVDAVIIPENRGVLVNDTVIRVSAGAVFNVPIIKVINLSQTIEKLKNNHYWIIGADMQGSMLESLDYSNNIALVIGNEGKGLSKKIKEKCDFLAQIPMQGETGSLNASVAAGIMLYEASKRRNNEIS